MPRSTVRSFPARLRRWALTLLLPLALVLASAGVVDLAERAVGVRIEALRGSGPSLARDAEAIRTSLAEIQGELARQFAAFGSESVQLGEPCSPVEWNPLHRQRLERRLADLEPAFARIDALLADEAARSVLRRGAVVVAESTSLVWTRRQTTALCARAVVAAERPGGSRDAARSLAAALDLAALTDDGGSGGTLVHVGLQSMVLGAAARALAAPGAEAAPFLEELAPRLATWSAERRVESALRRDLAPVLATESESEGAAFVPRRLSSLFWRIGVLGRFSQELEATALELDALGDGEGYALQPGTASWAGVREVVAAAFEGERAATLARVALALAARAQTDGAWPDRLDRVADVFGGQVPLDPFGRVPFEYRVGADEVVIACREAAESSESESTGRLWRFRR